MSAATQATRPAMVCWTLYDHPLDFPDAFVAREFLISSGPEPVPTAETITAATADELHELVRAQLHRCGQGAAIFFPHHPSDEPQIMGCWM